MSFNLVNLKKNSSSDSLKILFIHHSTGRNLIEQGGVRELIKNKNIQNGTSHEFWDVDYNKIGLTDPNGQRCNFSFNIPNDNTDPDGLERLFRQPIIHPPENAMSKVLLFDVVIFKSCYPASAIRSNAQLETYKRLYLSIRNTIKLHSEILFIPLTPPPLIPLPLPAVYPRWTNQNDAKRARDFSKWLTSDEFIDGLPNMFIFNFFDALAGSEHTTLDQNVLRHEYRRAFILDSHPNLMANRMVAPMFVNFIWESIRNYRQGYA